MTFSQAKYGTGGAVRGSCLIWCNYHRHSIPSQDLCLLMISVESRGILACSNASLSHTAIDFPLMYSFNIVKSAQFRQHYWHWMPVGYSFDCKRVCCRMFIASRETIF